MTEPEKSWASMWEYFDVKTSEPYSEVLAGRRMPGAEWITGAELIYAEHVLRNTSPESPAIMHRSEARLRDSVAALAAGLKAIGWRLTFPTGWRP